MAYMSICTDTHTHTQNPPTHCFSYMCLFLSSLFSSLLVPMSAYSMLWLILHPSVKNIPHSDSRKATWQTCTKCASAIMPNVHILADSRGRLLAHKRDLAKAWWLEGWGCRPLWFCHPYSTEPEHFCTKRRRLASAKHTNSVACDYWNDFFCLLWLIRRPFEANSINYGCLHTARGGKYDMIWCIATDAWKNLCYDNVLECLICFDT